MKASSVVQSSTTEEEVRLNEAPFDTHGAKAARSIGNCKVTLGSGTELSCQMLLFS
jgi:hypothetical protein